jgi:GT2 family glycosyltransferase
MVKIGVGVITCDRFNYLENCLKSLPKFNGPLVIVNDGKENIEEKCSFLKKTYSNLTFIQHKENKGVGISKNDALTFLLKKDVDHIFLLEDDILILKEDVFDKYIQASEASGILHFNYGPGSPFNRKQTIRNYDLHNRHLLDQHSEPNPKKIIDYGNNIKISLFEHTVAMFSYFRRKVLEDVGLHDEQFYNAWEHVDLTYRIIKSGYHPPFWWFADIFNSQEYLTEAPGAIDNSSIANKPDQWAKNVYGGREKYRQKHGHYPNALPYLHSVPEVISILKEIKKNYANN